MQRNRVPAFDNCQLCMYRDTDGEAQIPQINARAGKGLFALHGCARQWRIQGGRRLELRSGRCERVDHALQQVFDRPRRRAEQEVPNDDLDARVQDHSLARGRVSTPTPAERAICAPLPGCISMQ